MKKLNSIQYLRGMAALLVVIFHAELKVMRISSPGIEWRSFLEAGVDLFFIISGFVMAYIYYNRKFDVIEFLRSRFVRIVPLYWIYTTAALVVYWIIPSLVNSSGGSTSILKSYFLLPTEEKYLVQNGWTLSFELFFYLIFACGCLTFKFGKKVGFASFIVSFLVYCVLLVSSAQLSKSGFIWFDLIVVEFFLGIVAFYIYRNFSIDYKVIAIMLALAVGTLFLFQSGYHRLFSYGAPMFFILISFLLLEKKGKFQFENKYLLLLGNSSYSLYLSHAFTIAISGIVLKFAIPRGPESHLIFILSIFFLVTSSVLVGLLSYKFLETPLLRILK